MEALSVATVNVFSWGIFFAGGVMWASDTSGIDEIRQRLRVRLGLSEQEQKDSQEVVGEWIEAAKPWNAFKKAKMETIGSEKEEAGKAGKANERGTPPS